MSWMDLHMHSDKSCDGEYAPQALLRLCAAAGVSAAAIADHNTVRGAAEAAFCAAACGVKLIPAIELDCTLNGADFHVLGYGIDLTHAEFAANEAALSEREMASSGERLRLAKEACGLFFAEREAYALARGGFVTGEIIAEAALADPRNRAVLADYLPGGRRSDNPFVNFYWDFCSQGKPAYVPVEFISLDEAVAMIRRSGGAAVLAHPGNNAREDEALLAEIFARPLAGIEAFSSYHGPEQVAFYLDWARRNDVFVTAGSDFHGKTKPAIRLGDMDCGGREASILQNLTAYLR